MNNISNWLLNKEVNYSEKAIGFYKKRNRFSSLSILFNAFTGLLQNGNMPFWIQGTIGVDEKSGFIHKVKNTSANEHDITVFSELLTTKEIDTYDKVFYVIQKSFSKNPVSIWL